MKKILLLCILTLTACNLPSPVPSPAEQPLPTAYIDPSYPTLQAAPASAVQSASGIEVRMNRVWRDGKEVHAEVCYTLLDPSDWTIWNASLQYAGGSLSDFGSTLLTLQDASEGRSGLRCDDLAFFNVPPDADLTSAVLVIDAIAAPPRAEEYCTIYLFKIQQKLSERGIPITLACVESAGVETLQIVGKPDSMSQEEAEQIVFSDEFYTVRGPWSFSFNLGQ
jgi:hypothetical protein